MSRPALVLLAVALLGGCTSRPPLPPDAPEALVFSRTTEFRHSSIEAGIEALTDRAHDLGIRIVATEDPTYFDEDRLSGYRAVVFLNTTGDVLNDAQQLAFERYIQAGGGFVGIHSAADTEWKGNHWPWYTRLAGAAFLSHPTDNVQEARIDVVDASHPATAPLPAEWVRTDEYYDYQRLNPNVRTLLTVDESTYEGATTGDPHAISWFHEFDGGRAFYTGVGHTEESFEEDAVLDHIFGGLTWAMRDGDPVAPLDDPKHRPEDWRIVTEVLAEGIGEPMNMAFTPSGALYIVERNGTIRFWDEATRTTPEIAQLDVFTQAENGLAGIVFDPNYETNGWVYLYWAEAKDEEARPAYRLARYELRGTELDLDSEKILLTIPIERGPTSHEGGSMQFDADGNLWLSTGDDSNPHQSEGRAPLDSREAGTIYDSRRSAGNTQDLRGKILRLHPEADGSYSIPDGNLFDAAEDGRPEIYAMGLRNPFRLSVDSKTGVLYWGEIGPDADDDDATRGPRGFDEVNRTSSPGNFGWPFVIGPGLPYAEYDWETETAGPFFDPEALRNTSPRNTGLRELPPAQPAWLWYAYTDAGQFYDLESGSSETGRSAMAGPVFHRSDYAVTDQTLPSYYEGKLFLYEFVRDWVKLISMDDDGTIRKIEPFPIELDLVAPIDMKMGPDGTLYILEYGSTWFTRNADSRLSRVSYFSGDNPLPSARAAVAPVMGAVPLRLTLDGSESYDRNPDDELTYEWFLHGPDGSATSIANTENADITLEAPGQYNLELVVTDTGGGSSRSAVTVIAGNEPPEIDIQFSGNRSLYFDDESIDYTVRVSDNEDGSTEDGGIDPASVRVLAEYRPDGLAELLPSHSTRVAFGSLDPAVEAIDEYGCLSCHQPAADSAGPAFEKIAARYEGNLEHARPLAQKMIEGGQGVWGDRAMPAQPHVTEERALQIANYILRGSAEGGVGGHPLEGPIQFNQHEAEETELVGRLLRGTYVLQATYTDEGGEGAAGPTTRRERYVVRPARMPVSAADNVPVGDRLALRMDMVPESFRSYVPAIPEGLSFVIARNGGFISYDDLDLTGIRRIAIYGTAPSMAMSGGFIDIHLDAPDGPLLGSIEMASTLLPTMTGGELAFEPVDGLQDLYLVFRNDDVDENRFIFMPAMIEFKRS